MDDFGDLYAGLEEHIAAVSCAEGVNKSDSTGKDSDSTGKDRYSNGQIDEASGKETTVSEDGVMVAEGSESSDSSESEDDLHIVLNEEDCRKFLPYETGDLANGGVPSGWRDDEDEGGLVLVTGNDHRPYKDQKWADDQQLTVGFAQGGAERGSTTKSGYPNWHVGSHLLGRTSISGRGDWDHMMMPCSEGTASGATGFYLPRNRTIFDIDIEKFEQKPWNHHGVDITDYFNFGLDEESWKHYYKCMEHIRQQARISRSPIYESSRLNQVLETEMVSNKTLSGYQGEQGNELSSIHEKVDEGGRGFEMPRGRAIQVRGSFAERIPSTDMRRRILRDSDAVIQIVMEDSTRNSSVPYEEDPHHVVQGNADGSDVKSENEFNKSLSAGHHDGKKRFREIIDPTGHQYREKGDFPPDGLTFEAKAKLDFSEDDAVYPLGASASLLVFDNSSSSDFECRPEASRGGLSLCKVLSSNSIEAAYVISNDSGSDCIRREQENGKRTRECDISNGDRKHSRRTRLQNRTGFTVCPNGAKDFFRDRKCQNVSDKTDVSYSTRESDYDIDTRKRLSSYEETKTLRSYRSKREAEKHSNDKTYIRNFHERGHHYTSLSRNHEDKELLHKQRVSSRDDHFHGKYHVDRRMRVASCKDSSQSNSRYKLLLKEKNGHLLRKKEGKNECRQIEDGYHDFVIEERYQDEYIQEMYRRHTPDYEEEIFNHEYGRHVSHTATKLKYSERRHSSNSCFELSSSRRYIENGAKYHDHRLLDSRTYRESPIAEESSWLDANCLTNYSPPCRSNKGHVDHRRSPNTRGLQSKSSKDGCYLIRSSMFRRRSCENALDFDLDDNFAEDRDLYIDHNGTNEKRGNYGLSNPRPSDELRFRHQKWDSLSYAEGSSLRHWSPRHESCLTEQCWNDRKSSDKHLFNDARKNTSSGCSSHDHIGVNSHILGKERHEQASLVHREAVNMHVNGWKEKVPKRKHEVAHGSGRGNNTNHKTNKKLKDGANIEGVNAKVEIPPRKSQPGRFTTHPTSLQSDKMKDYRPRHSNDFVIKDHVDKNSILQDDQDDEIEEGQLIEDPNDQDVAPVATSWNLDRKTMHRAIEACGLGSTDEKTKLSEASTLAKDRILETLARMQKRKERFNEPITRKPVPEKIQSPPIEVEAIMEAAKQERPARKRRWCGS